MNMDRFSADPKPYDNINTDEDDEDRELDAEHRAERARDLEGTDPREYH